MNRAILLITLVSLLSACVPIPPKPPLASPTSGIKGGLTDLANVLAKADDHPTSTEYVELLSGLEKCLWTESESEENLEYANEEVVAGFIFNVGAHVANKLNELYMLSEESDEDAIKSNERIFYQLLLLVDQDCKEYDHRSN